MLDKKLVKNQLEELSAKGGGSLVKRVIKSKLNSNSKILVIGLGGMGCKTVNAMKRIYSNEFASSSNIRFLAIDTDSNALSKVAVINGGYLSPGESFEIYSSEARNLLIDRPPIVRQWLSNSVESRPINPDGAQGVRAVGRVMLCGTSKYEALRDYISGIMDELSMNMTETEKLNVVLVAGISGGTGSGTFIDVGYMIRSLLKEKKDNNSVASEYFGIFYTPDVQKSVPEIGGDEATYSNLRRNGYAALKELDYFMTVGKESSGKPVYSVQVPSGKVYSSTQPMFDKNRVFIISATAKCSKCDDIIKSTAASFLNMFRDGERDDNGTQSVISTLCNKNGQMATWVVNNAATAANNLESDPSGNINCSFPAFMNYNYASFGYRSIYFPRNEMAAYFANEAFMRVYDVWKRAFQFTQKTIDGLAQQCGIGDFDAVYTSACAALGINSDEFRIKPEDHDNYPVRRGTSLLGRVTGLDDTVAAAKGLVDAKLRAIGNPSPKIISQIVSPIIANVKGLILDNSTFLENYGPYGGIVALSGNNGNPCGLIDILGGFINNFNTVLNNKQEKLRVAQSNLDAGKTTLANDSNPHDDEIEAFIDICQQFSKTYFEEEFYRLYMPRILSGLVTELNALNSETFEIFVPVIDALKDLLNEDSVAFSDSIYQRTGNTTTYSLNAFNMNSALQSNGLFRSLFDGYVDNEKVKQVADGFAKSIFGKDSREKWKKIVSDPAVLADELRSIFNSVTAPIVTDMLQKLIVIIYGNSASLLQAAGSQGQTISIEDINRIWNNTSVRDTALRSAAKNIVDALTGNIMTAFDVPDTQIKQISRSASVILLNETPELNHFIELELQRVFGQQYSCSYVGNSHTCERKTEVTMAMMLAPFSLPIVKNMKDYAERYFKSERGETSAAGRHLDEVTECWQFNLPEIYGADAEDYFGGPIFNRTDAAITPEYRKMNDDGTVKDNDREQYERIRKAVEYGIKNGFIYKDDTIKKYEMIVLNSGGINKNDPRPELLKRISSVLPEIRLDQQNDSLTWIDALKYIEETEHHTMHEEIVIDEYVNNEALKNRECIEPSDPYEYKNIYRIFRADMRMTKILFETAEYFKSMQFFENLENISNLGSVVELFLNAFKCGLITHNEENRTWLVKYSNNIYNTDVLFFDEKLRKSDEFDQPLSWYLLISAFAEKALEPKIKDGITAIYNEKVHNMSGFESVETIVNEIISMLDSPLFTNSDADIRDMQIRKCYSNSNYRKYYSYPTAFSGTDSIINNVKQIINTVKDYARFKGVN